MATLIDRIIGDDFVWDAITNNIHGLRKQSAKDFISINCPLCVTRGETPDRKQRLGLKRNADGVGFNCFNCGAKGIWVRGELLSKSMKELLLGLGLSDIEVKRLNLRAMSYREILTSTPETMALVPNMMAPHFDAAPLPKGARKIEDWANAGCMEQDFIDSVDYLFSRGDDIFSAHPYYWTPDEKLRRRVIIPFFHDGHTVGFTSRAIDANAGRRYIMESPPNFLFNCKALVDHTRKYVILCEGVFDAIAVDGVGLLGAHLNTQQIAWIKNYGKTIILLPDRDRRGETLIETALLNNFHVAFPVLRDGHGRENWWDSDVKDAAEACKRYGRLFTLQSIIATATNNKIRIQQYAKLLY